MNLAQLDFREKYWEPKRFNSRHKACCVLRANGFTVTEIAEHMGYTIARVSIILNDDRAEEVLLDAEKHFASNLSDVGIKIKALAMEALEETAEIMRGGFDGIEVKPPTRLTAALGILDRAGYSKVNKSIALVAEIPVETARLLIGVEEEEIEEADYSFEG